MPELPYLGTDRPELVLTHRLAQGNLLFVLNPTETELSVWYRLSELFGEGDWIQARYHPDGMMDTKKEDLVPLTLPPHASALLFVTEQELQATPRNLWDW